MLRFLTIVPGLLLALVATAHAGPVSRYYVVAGDQSRADVLQGAVVVGGWGTTIGESEYPVAVAGTVKTLGPSIGRTGREYSLSGVPTGPTYTNNVTTAWDATTDGTFIYMVSWINGDVVRLDGNWANPVTLFNSGGGNNFLGITYDPTNNSLWLAQFGGGTIENRTLGGTLLSSFNTGISPQAALALDHADNSLWVVRYTQNGDFEQFSKTGTPLGSQHYPALVGTNPLGGEFDFTGVSGTCGDGVVDAGEACDDGNVASGDCCSSTCQIEPNGTPCRPVAGACDLAEACDGVTPTCPADSVQGAFVVCRPNAGACDISESCDGATPACPPDSVQGAFVVCRSAAGACDVAEICDGATPVCPPDSVLGALVVCRSAAAACDVAENCDGLGPACPPDSSAAAGTPCPDDGSVCTTDECDGAGACEHEFPSAAGCQPALALKSSLLVKKGSDPSKDKVSWKWKGSGTIVPADFGSPTTTSGYSLCVADGNGELVLDLSVPAGDTCAGRPCWTATSTGFKYKDRELSPDGILSGVLKAGGPGRASEKIKGKGTNLGIGTLGLALPVTGRLVRNDSPVCWEGRYSTPIKNDGIQFKAKSD